MKGKTSFGFAVALKTVSGLDTQTVWICGFQVVRLIVVLVFRGPSETSPGIFGFVRNHFPRIGWD